MLFYLISVLPSRYRCSIVGGKPLRLKVQFHFSLIIISRPDQVVNNDNFTCLIIQHCFQITDIKFIIEILSIWADWKILYWYQIQFEIIFFNLVGWKMKVFFKVIISPKWGAPKFYKINIYGAIFFLIKISGLHWSCAVWSFDWFLLWSNLNFLRTIFLTVKNAILVLLLFVYFVYQCFFVFFSKN